MRAIVESIEFSQVLPKPTKAPSASSAGKTESAISGVVNTAKDSGALRNLIIGVLIGLAVLVVALIIIIVIAVSVSHKRAKKKAAQQISAGPFSGQPYDRRLTQPPSSPTLLSAAGAATMNPARPPVVQPHAPSSRADPEHGPDDRSWG